MATRQPKKPKPLSLRTAANWLIEELAALGYHEESMTSKYEADFIAALRATKAAINRERRKKIREP